MKEQNSILETAAFLWWGSLDELQIKAVIQKYHPETRGIPQLTISEITELYTKEHPTKALLESPTDNKGEEGGSNEDSLDKLAEDYANESYDKNDGNKATEWINRKYNFISGYNAAYSTLKADNLKLLSDVKALKELESNFYMAICRAYNAGKQCMSNQHEDARNKGKEAFSNRFISSHDYFVGEFPEFKTNVP